MATLRSEKENNTARNEAELPVYLFHQGTNFRAYEYLGAHPIDGGFVFRVWAPDAAAVAVTGDFDGWQGTLAMTRISEGGVWEAEGMARAFTAAHGINILLPPPTADGFTKPTRMHLRRSARPIPRRSCTAYRSTSGMTAAGWRRVPTRA